MTTPTNISTIHTPVQAKLLEFFSHYKQQQFAAGHVIQAAYSQPAGVYLVTSGLVKQYVLTSEGQELLVNFYKPFSFFPMISSINQVPNMYFFESVEPTEVYRAPIEDLMAFLQSEPSLMWDLLQRLYAGLDSLLQQMTYNSVGTTEQKVVSALINLAHRFGEQQESGVVLVRHFTHKEMSAITGASRESVSRTIHNLTEQSLITITGRELTIPMLSRLQSLLVGM
jgi:CRP-like cAMP-binding protein